MQRRHSQLLQRLQMSARRIALVLCQPIAGILLVERHHFAIPLHLGENGCRSDCRHPIVAFNYGFGCVMPTRQAVAVDQNIFWLHLKRLHGAFHRQHAGVEDIEFINLGHTGARDRPAQGTLADRLGQIVSLGLTEFLGITQTIYRPIGIENHCGGDNVAGERPAPYFVDTSQ